MNHAELFQLRETCNRQRILVCFNGSFTQGLIEEIGSALRKHMLSEEAPPSSALDVFAVYIEIAQNIREYSVSHGYSESDSSAIVVVSRDDDGKYVISACNAVERGDGQWLEARINGLAEMDKGELKVSYKAQLRKPRDTSPNTAGLGLIDIARKSSVPITCSLRQEPSSTRSLFSLRVVI